MFDIATAIPVKRDETGEFSAIGQFDITTARPLDPSTQTALREKPTPEIRAEREPRYHRPLTEEERAQAVVETVYKAGGEKTPFGLKVEWVIESPEARAITETVLLPMVTALKAARGIAEMNVPANSIPKMILDGAKRGILEPDVTEPLGASIVKAYPEVDWRVAGAIGTMAEFGILAPRLFTNMANSFGKESQFNAAVSEIRKSPIWQKGVARLSAVTGIPPEQVDIDIARYIWKNKNRVSYLRILAARSKYGLGVNLFGDSAGYVRLSKGLQPGDLVRWGQEVGSVSKIVGDKATIQIGKEIVRVAINQLLAIKPELLSRGFEENQISRAKPEALQEIVSKNLKSEQVSILPNGKLRIISEQPITEVTPPKIEEVKPLTASEAVARGMSAEEWVGSKKIKAFRYGKKKDDVVFSSKMKDYSEEYAKVKGGKIEEIKEIEFVASNPLIVTASPKEFSDPSFENKYIQQAKEGGNDVVIFKEKESGDEFYAQIKQNIKTKSQLLADYKKAKAGKAGISKEAIDKGTFAMLFEDEQQFVTIRIMEGKSLAQTAKKLGMSLEDAAEEEKYIAKRIQEIKELKETPPERLEQSLEQSMSELNAQRKELREYLEGKLRPELRATGEFADLKHLDWLFAKEGDISYTPDELYTGLNQIMGWSINSDDELRQLIKDYFIKDIRKEAAKSVTRIEKEARKKLEKALAGPSRQKIEEEMRLGKLRIIADQLTKLAEIAPHLVTPKQIAYAYVLKEKNILSDHQFARLKKIFAGKRNMKVTTPTGKLKKEPMTKEEAGELIKALQSVVPPRGPHVTGQPPVIPTSKALMISEWAGPFNDLTDFQAAPLSGLDPIRAAELVDGKPYGAVRRYIVEPAREAEHQSKHELKRTLDTLTEISEGMGSKSRSSELVFKYIEKTFTPAEEKQITDAIEDTANYMRRIYDELLERINQVRTLVNKIPVQKRQDYITHIQELSLLDEFYQGLSNVPDDAINIPAFAKSNSPFFRFALQRLGGEEFKLDAIDAFRTYATKAYSVIYNTPILKAARPLVDRLPHNAYKYFSQYLDETMALRPAQVDKVIPKPILGGINWLKRQMGKGAILGNLASVFNQVFTLPHTISAVGPKWVASAALKMGDDSWRAFIEAHSKVLQGRMFEIDFDPTLLSKVDNALGFLLHVSDREQVRIAFGAQFEKSLSRGATFEQAVREADDIAFKTQSGFNLAELAPAFRSKIAGSVLQFQNTVNGGLNYLKFDIGKEYTEKGTERARLNVFKAGLLWLSTLLVLNKVYREFGIPSAIDEWTDIFPLISIAEYGLPVTYSGPAALLQLVLAKTPQDRTQANRALRRSIFLFLPAGNQVRKTLEGIYAVSQGGKFDKRGRLLFPITGTAEKTRAVLFGPYGTKAGREYRERGFKPERKRYRERVILRE